MKTRNKKYNKIINKVNKETFIYDKNLETILSNLNLKSGNYKNKYGKYNKTILVVGNYDKSGNNMKGKEITICKKFRRIFINIGYKHIW